MNNKSTKTRLLRDAIYQYSVQVLRATEREGWWVGRFLDESEYDILQT